jgi:HSP20 family protein
MYENSKIWCPAIALNETKTNLILKAEVPGVEINHLNIHAETDSISISGIHNRDDSKNETELISSQLHYGQIQCQVSLPVKIQIEQVRAELIDGVLTITMPKLNVVSTVSS